MLDVYAAREDPEPGVTGRLVADAVPGGHARFVPDPVLVTALVARIAEPGDLVLTMGAGDITALGPRLVDALGGPGSDQSSGSSRGGTVAPDQAAADSPAADPGRAADLDAVPDDRQAGADEPVQDDARPRSRRRRSWRTAFFSLISVGVVAAGAWALFLSPWLVVRSVVVTGNHLVSRSQVLAVAKVDQGTPLIRVNTGQVAARVGTIAQVAGVARRQVLARPAGDHGARAHPCDGRYTAQRGI